MLYLIKSYSDERVVRDIYAVDGALYHIEMNLSHIEFTSYILTINLINIKSYNEMFDR